MSELNNEQIQVIFLSLAWDIVLAAMVTGSVLAIFVGLWSIFRPASFMRFNQRLNRWIDTSQKTTLSMNKKVVIEQYFYRHNRVFGTLLSIAAIWILFKLVFDLNKAALESTLSIFMGKVSVELLVDVSFGYAYLAAVIALLVGLIVLLRPSALKNVEAWGNQWIETGEVLEKLDAATHSPDRWVEKHPVIFGLFASIGGAVILFYMLSHSS